MASLGSCKVQKLAEDSGFPAFVAQRTEHLTTDQKVGAPPLRFDFVQGRYARSFC